MNAPGTGRSCVIDTYINNNPADGGTTVKVFTAEWFLTLPTSLVKTKKNLIINFYNKR
ncbi:hypothetical protein SAMN05660816_06853 [Niastella yeongjuensis]|nr:hypothetical protein SAMN05660816_06853 [Niastella yeongjuensis]